MKLQGIINYKLTLFIIYLFFIRLTIKSKGEYHANKYWKSSEVKKNF